MSRETEGPQLRLSSADLPTLVDVWEDTARAFSALVHSLDEQQWSLPTPCPEWTVGDIVRHAAAIESELTGAPQPEQEVDWSAFPHVGDNPMSQWTERGIDSRRGRSHDEVLAELDGAVAERSAQLRGGDLSPDASGLGPGGVQRPLETSLRMRTFDLWVHDQDIRAAIGRPGDLGTDGAHATAHTLVSALPFVLGKKVGAAPGTSVRVRVTGDVEFDRTVEVGADGRAGFVTGDTATATVELTWPDFVTLGCGRGDAPAVISGDRELGARFVAELAIAP